MSNLISGWICLDKPAGLSSAKVVAIVRKALGVKKIGHGGTLDPLAQGVLPLALNEATKTTSYVFNDEKEYIFEATWGSATTTDDKEGEVTEVSEFRPTEELILKALPDFVGEIQQTPPIFSALKVNGKRAYELARSGQEVSLKPRSVQVHSLGLLEIVDEDRALFRVKCGKGTYVRSLARDIGEKLGTKAHVSKLIRTKVGKFYLENTISLEKIQELGHKVHTKDYICSIAEVLDDIPALCLSEDQQKKLVQGQEVYINQEQAMGLADLVLCLNLKGQAIAIGSFEESRIKPKRVFNL